MTLDISWFKSFSYIYIINLVRLVDIISKLQLQKASVSRHMTSVVQPILEKGIVDHSIIHRLLMEYVTIADQVLEMFWCTSYSSITLNDFCNCVFKTSIDFFFFFESYWLKVFCGRGYPTIIGSASRSDDPYKRWIQDWYVVCQAWEC